jgi:DNA modification methylase
VNKLKPFPGNPRKHDTDVEHLVKSIEHFGWTNPVLVQEKTNRIIAGHGRIEAAKRANLQSVPCIFLDLNDADASAYTVADNKLAELSTWDQEKLTAMLAELKLTNYDMGLMGYTDDELNQLLTPAGDDLERTDLDDVPDLPKTATTKKGQLWQLGEHSLLCGDSTERSQVNRVIGEGLADLVFTDPPYGVSYVGKTKAAMTITNDNLGDAGTRALVADAARAWPLKPGGCFYVCGPAGETETAFRLALREAGLVLRQCLVWAKNHFVMGRQDYHWRHETILYGWMDGAAHYFIDDRTQDTIMDEGKSLTTLSNEQLIELIKAFQRNENTTVWREDRPASSQLHPTTKPIALVQKAIRNSSLVNARVFDGFGGSGSTLIAAHYIGRRAVLMEVDPRYCDVIIERWETVSGGKAQLKK